MIWREVSRQALVTMLLAASVTVLCRWGVAGAAAEFYSQRQSPRW